MKQPKQEQITIEHVIESYKLLQSQDPEQQYKANKFLIGICHRNQAWDIAQNMLSNLQDVKFQLLGTQILYQKVSHEIQNLTLQEKNLLKQFVFTKLADPNIKQSAIIDKLASVGALIGCTSCMAGQGWENIIQDLISFMKMSQHNLRSGIYVLERIPEQLRATNRVNMSKKNNIIARMLQNERQLAALYLQILFINNDYMVKKCMQAMQSWAKSQFKFLMYPQLIKKVLLASLQSFSKFQSGIIMLLQTIKGACLNRIVNSTSISEWQPQKQLNNFSPQQIQSVKLIIQFIIENQKNFLSKSVESQYLDMYIDIIKQSLLSFGFLIKQQIGFKMLQIIMHFSKSSDLRISQSTFQFWMDFGDKMLKCKIDQNIKNLFAQTVNQLFQVVASKVMVDSQILLDDPDLKQDVTIDDDINAMSFSQYRKQSVPLFQHFYNFFLNFTGSPKYYFDKCFQFIGNQKDGQLGKGTQLALFCIKSAVQSMISQTDAEYICKFLNFVISKGTNIFSRIAVQTLLLIRDCTRQIKRDDPLCLSVLSYSLFFLKDERICYYAAQAFKILMETLTIINDPNVVANMINYYRNQKFPNQQIIDKIIQGIFSTVMKMKDTALITNYISQLVKIILQRFQKVHANIQALDEKPYLLPLLQMKTLQQNFDGLKQQQKQKYHEIHKQILGLGLKMIMITIPYCLKQKQKYVKFNQLGVSCSIYKLALKLCRHNISQEFLHILDETLKVVTKESIVDMYPVLELLCYTMTHFIPNNVEKFNLWLFQRIKYINTFFLTYLQPINLADVDIIKCYYQIQQSLVLYNSQIFLSVGNCYDIYDLALYILRHLNQSKMQRKIVNFLYICSQMTQVFYDRYTKVVEIILGSIPIVSGISHHNLSRTFLHVADKLPNIEQIIRSCLNSNPYQNISQNIIKLLVNMIMLTIRPTCDIPINKKERRFMMMIKDLNELAKNGELPNQIIQLEFRYHHWLKNKGEDD